MPMTLLTSDRVLYTPERLASIATEAAKGDAVFSLKDRIGLVHDAFALSRAGFAQVSSALTFVDIIKDETECEQCAWFFVCWLTNKSNHQSLGVGLCRRKSIHSCVSVVGRASFDSFSEYVPSGMCFNNSRCLIVQTEVPFAGVIQPSGCSFRIRIL
jgi:ERAP1-like C-terminal domain